MQLWELRVNLDGSIGNMIHSYLMNVRHKENNLDGIGQELI